jgi:type II secretory pathway component PulF
VTVEDNRKPKGPLVVFAALTALILAVGLALLSLVPGLALLLLVGMFYGWMFYAFIYYRQGRQQEFGRLLITAAEARAPLAPVLRAYVEDRPHGALREAWVAVLLWFVVPGYYWLWHRRNSYDRKVEHVARLLENGAPLHVALASTPGVVSSETVLAAAVGESTGRLADCLQPPARRRVAAAWLEVTPRFLYPLILLLFMAQVTGFWMLYIGPRMRRIFADFHEKMPAMTSRLFAAWDLVTASGGLTVLAILGVLVLIAVVAGSRTVRWYVPGIGRLYRMDVRGRILQMLSVLLGAGQRVPQALELLAGASYFPPVVTRRLEKARDAVERGEPLAESLRAQKLLSSAMAPLVEAAQRAGNLPWALGELGETLADRTVRLMRRWSMVLAPLAVVAIGALACCLVLGMFLPLVELIMGLSE